MRVAGDPEGRWAAGLPPRPGSPASPPAPCPLALAPGADAQVVLDRRARRRPGGALRLRGRRLSDVFREAVGADVDEVDRAAREERAAARPRRRTLVTRLARDRLAGRRARAAAGDARAILPHRHRPARRGRGGRRRSSRRRSHGTPEDAEGRHRRRSGPAAVPRSASPRASPAGPCRPVPFASLAEAEAALRDGTPRGRARPRARGAHRPHALRRDDRRTASSLSGALALAGGLVAAAGRRRATPSAAPSLPDPRPEPAAHRLERAAHGARRLDRDLHHHPHLRRRASPSA